MIGCGGEARMEKRKAATSLFMEQQMAEAEAPAELANEIADDRLMSAKSVADYASAGAGAPMAAPAPAAAMRRAAPQRQRVVLSGLKTSEEMQLEKEPIGVRETGAWFWRRVIVPPNAYVVHTRINRKDPVTLGMGISFRFKPGKDAYQVVPAAVQTIGVVANCITREKQGINVLAYVQWQIDDFGIAYKRLDVSDTRDPLGIVNAQLREQAEAAIKDKIATMSVDEVLTDKAPVIEELTTRLKLVTEGQKGPGAGSDGGLGIKIITVQIREALVSSQTLWSNLQAPFRHQKEQDARISELGMNDELRRKELEARKNEETEQATTEAEIARIRELRQSEAQELTLKEQGIRFEREQQAIRDKLALEEQTEIARRETQQRLERKEAELRLATEMDELRIGSERATAQARVTLEAHRRDKALEADKVIAETEERSRSEERQRAHEIKKLAEDTVVQQKRGAYRLAAQQQEDALAGEVLRARLERGRQEHEFGIRTQEEKQRLEAALEQGRVGVERMRQEIRNLISGNDLMSRLITELSAIADALPDVQEMKVLQTGGDNQALDALAGFLAKFMALAETLGIRLPGVREPGAAPQPPRG
jgi:flotillin